MGTQVSVDQPETMEDRLQIVRDFIDANNFSIPVLVDDMQNSFCDALSVWPERYFVLNGTEFSHVASPSTEFGYDRLSLRRTLRSLLGTHDLLASAGDHYAAMTSSSESRAPLEIDAVTSLDEDVDLVKRGEVVNSSIPYFFPTDEGVTESCLPPHLCQTA